MSLREKMNDNPRVVGGIIAGLIVLMLVMFFWPGGSDSDVAPTGAKGSYFSEDNGKTFFVAAPGSIPGQAKGPSGQVAYVAKVWQYPGEAPVVGWLEHYTPKGITALQEFYGNSANKELPIEAANQDAERLLKRPGTEKWVRNGAPGASDIINGPAKGGQQPSMVVPE